MTAAKTRRQWDSGSIYPEKKGGELTGRFIARIDAGYTESGGRRQWKRVCKSEAAARQAVRDMKRDLQDGASAATRLNVKAWLEQWLDIRKAKIRPKTYSGYASVIRQWVVPSIGHKRLDQLSPADMRAVTTRVRQAGRSSTTARLAHVVLCAALKDAQREGHAVPPRVLLVDPPSKAANDRTAISVVDALALLKVAAGDPDGSRWVAALLQGMRQGECLGLTWELVDLRAGTVDISWQLQEIPYEHGCTQRCGRRFGGDCPARVQRVPDGFELRRLDGALCLTRPKTQSGQRIIPLVPWMVEALSAWRMVAPASPHDLVWPREDGRPALSDEDREAWHALQERAGVRHPAGRVYHLHEARHTTATLLAEAGVDPSTIMAILGHSSVATQAAYKHVRLDHVREALETVAGRLELTGPSALVRSG